MKRCRHAGIKTDQRRKSTRNLWQWRQPDHGCHRPYQLFWRDPSQWGYLQRCCSDPDVQILVWPDKRYCSEPYDLRRHKGYAGILPAEKVWGKDHDVPQITYAADRVHRPWLYHRKRLGKLQERRHCLRDPSSGRIKGIRQTPGADLHPVHKSWDRWPRREYLLRAEHWPSREIFPGKRSWICRAPSRHNDRFI